MHVPSPMHHTQPMMHPAQFSNQMFVCKAQSVRRPFNVIYFRAQQAQAEQHAPVKKAQPISKAESRRRSEAMYKSLSEDARASVAGIIDEVGWGLNPRGIACCRSHSPLRNAGDHRIARRAYAREGKRILEFGEYVYHWRGQTGEQ